MFLWRFRILFRWPPNISHTAHKSLSRVRITFRAEHITFPQFYWQMCLFNLQLSVGFYSRTTVDISQSAPACCKTAVFTLFEHILPRELKVLYWLVQSGDERRALVKTILFHLDDKWNNLTFQAPPSQQFPQIWKGPKRPKWTGLGVTTGHQSPSRKYSLHCKVDTPFTDNLVSDTWFRWLGNNCLDWIWDGRGFIMVSSVRHLEHPEIPYLNTSSPKTS